MTKSLLKNITNKFIVIEGNIGSGKTSLAKKISSQFGGKLILEKFSTNPFLPEFYKDPESNALPLELFFLAERFRQLNDKQNLNDLFNKFTISDYAFFKSKLFAQNNLRDNELNLFNKLFNSMYSSMKKPDMIIYLHSNIERLQINISKRGREYEKKIEDSYLLNLEKKYLDYLKKQNEFPILILDISEVDFLKSEEAYNNIIKEIQNFNKDNGYITSKLRRPM